MPTNDLLRLFEELVLVHLPLADQVVDHGVVKADEEQVKLREDDVLVVAGVPDEGSSLLVAGQVLGGRGGVDGAVRDEQLPAWRVGPLPVVQERLVHGTGAVDAVEVQARGAEVDERVRVVGLVELRHRVERDVVVDELAEVRESGGSGRVVGAPGGIVVRHPLDELLDRLRSGLAPLQVRQHLTEASPRRPPAGIDVLATGDGYAVPVDPLAGLAQTTTVSAAGPLAGPGHPRIG